MAGDFITLPIRLTARAASFALRTTEEVATRTITFALQLAGVGRSPDTADFAEPQPAQSEDGGPEAATEREAVDEAAAPSPPEVSSDPGIDFDAPPVTEPAHVSEEPTLAAEFAEPGAEDGAGAQVRVLEPWPGYGELTAKDVLDRIGDATAEELAAIELFEGTHQRRQTVLSAVERQLRMTSRSNRLD